MPIQCQILPERRAAYMRATGRVTIDEILKSGVDLFGHERWQNGYDLLIDYRATESMSVSAADVDRIAQQDKRNAPLIDRSRCAVVAESDLVFGLSRMWESVSEESVLMKMVFRDIDEALRWLGWEPDLLGEFDFAR